MHYGFFGITAAVLNQSSIAESVIEIDYCPEAGQCPLIRLHTFPG
ncbi:MAG: hypothetical protein ACLPLZ_01310 [Terracidiphilus sp.]